MCTNNTRLKYATHLNGPIILIVVSWNISFPISFHSTSSNAIP